MNPSHLLDPVPRPPPRPCALLPGETVPASDSDEDQGTLRLDGVLREQEVYMLARLGEKYALEPEVRAPAVADTVD